MEDGSVEVWKFGRVEVWKSGSVEGVRARKSVYAKVWKHRIVPVTVFVSDRTMSDKYKD